MRPLNTDCDAEEEGSERLIVAKPIHSNTPRGFNRPLHDVMRNR